MTHWLGYFEPYLAISTKILRRGTDARDRQDMGDWQFEEKLSPQAQCFLKLPISSGLSVSMSLNSGIPPPKVRAQSGNTPPKVLPCSRGHMRSSRSVGPNAGFASVRAISSLCVGKGHIPTGGGSPAQSRTPHVPPPTRGGVPDFQIFENRF